MDAVTLALCKKYVNESLVGIGAIKGAPCEIQSVNKVSGVTTVTLKWTDTTGVNHTTSFDIEDGISVSAAKIDEKGYLKLTLTDGNELNCGKVNSQFDTMPIPSASNVGAIVQYTGNSTLQYTNGYFYQCVLDNGTFEWIQKNVQPGGGSDIQINYLPTPSAAEEGKIYQYIGSTNTNYIQGCFYQCIKDSTTGTYSWEAISVEDPDTYESDPVDFNNDW